MAAYYNEIEPFKAEYLRVLIREKVIADGEVDERSIEEVQPEDLRGFTQCHFFAGIGVWSYALRLAGWPDSRPVWTGSCPCPSFSAAGKGKGFNDPRHLWPHWFRLIRESRPATLFGEQVDAAIGHGWLDLVSTDLEAEKYAVGAAVLGAHSIGAPHRRQRLYFVADSQFERQQQFTDASRQGAGILYSQAGSKKCVQPISGCGSSERTAGSGPDSEYAKRRSVNEHRQDGRNGADDRRPEAYSKPRARSEVCDDGHAEQPRLERLAGDVRDWRGPGWLDPEQARSASEAGATRGFWRDCDWWYGRDGKYRPIEPGLFPLAHGTPGRVGLLRAYGDCIVPEVAQALIEAYCAAKNLLTGGR